MNSLFSTRPSHPSHPSRPRLVRQLVVLAAAALAAACASPAWQSIAPGTSQDELQARLGAPREVYPLPDGSRRWLYPAPGETRWAADINAQGRVTSVRQILSAEEFGRARIGEWTTRDVLTRFGKPAEISRFPLMHREVWGYRFAQNSQEYATMNFYFDPAGVLRLTQVIPDFMTES